MEESKIHQTGIKALAAIFLMLLAAPADGKTTSAMAVDYLTFRSAEPGMTYLEYYFVLTNKQLHFVRDASGFKTVVSATLYLFNEDKTLEIQQSIQKEIINAQYSETRDGSIGHLFKLGLSVRPGNYKSLLVLDDKNSSQRLKIEKEIACTDYYSAPGISSIQLSIADGEKGESLPNVARRFSYKNPTVVIYYESYNLTEVVKNDGNVLTNYKVVDSNGKVWHDADEKIPVTISNPAFRLNFSVAHLPTDTYRFVVTQEAGTQAISSETYFHVRQSPLDIRFKRFSDAVDELRYIASEEEINEMYQVPAQQRNEILKSFWAKRDPTPGSAKNELMEEYYKRLDHANLVFTKDDLPGYKSDFGMIYVLFGEPDRVYAKTGSFLKETRQVWYYSNLDLAFTFVGFNGFAPFNLLDKQETLAEYMPR